MFWLWSDLVDDNSSLRAVINGKVISVPTKEARLIGDILGHSQLGVGDWWYARRML